MPMDAAASGVGNVISTALSVSLLAFAASSVDRMVRTGRDLDTDMMCWSRCSDGRTHWCGRKANDASIKTTAIMQIIKHGEPIFY